MSTESPAPAPEPSTPEVITEERRVSIGRTGIALNVALQLLLVFGLFVIVNYLSFRHYKRWDMTATRDFTLSESSQNLLKSLSRDIDITVIFSKESKIEDDVRSLAEEYRRHGKGRVKYKDINPNRSPNSVVEIEQKLKTDLKRNVVIVRSGSRVKLITEEEMIIEDPKFLGQNRSIEVRAEDAISSAIMNVTEGETHRFYFLAGKGGRSDLAKILVAFTELGLQQNMEVLPLNLAETTEIPEDAGGLILMGPKYDLVQREVEMISASLSKNRSMLVLRDPNGETPRLDAMLKEYGIFPRNDRVLYAETTSAGPAKQFNVHGSFVAGSPITDPFGAATTAFTTPSSSLALALESEELEKRNVRITPLLQAAKQYWGEVDFQDPLPQPGPQDTQPPVWLAAAAERGYVADARLRGIHGMRLVVLGNAGLLDEEGRLRSNDDFVSASMNWLLDRSQIIGVTPKRRQRYRIFISSQQSQRIFWILTITMPAAVLCFGFFVWGARRS